jgi:hypothetical protein
LVRLKISIFFKWLIDVFSRRNGPLGEETSLAEMSAGRSRVIASCWLCSLNLARQPDGGQNAFLVAAG